MFINLSKLKLVANMSLLVIWVLLLLITQWLSTPVTGYSLSIPRRVRCRSIANSPCFNMYFLCPIACPSTCLMDCVSCKPVCSCTTPGAICEDPRFIGGDGITFYFHGRKDRDFCLVSDPNLHINGHFIGKRNPNLKRDFTWVQAIGILIDNHKLLIAANRTPKWDEHEDHLLITYNNTPILLPRVEGARWKSMNEPRVTITRMSDANKITLEVTGSFRANVAVVPILEKESRVHGYGVVDGEDCFAHLELGFKFYNLSNVVDGVLGQTYRSNYVSKAMVNVPMPVMGGMRKYSTSKIFATDCEASQFGLNIGSGNGHGVILQNPTIMKCNSGVKGMGLVCKR